MDAVKSKSKLLLSGLAFFHAMGFAKPEDAVVRSLSSCKLDKCIVRAFLTNDGLTQLSLLMHSAHQLPVRDTAQALKCRMEPMQEVFHILGDTPDLMEYTMDAQGCSLAVGYMFPRRGTHVDGAL